jgi:hypothetical protein
MAHGKTEMVREAREKMHIAGLTTAQQYEEVRLTSDGTTIYLGELTDEELASIILRYTK